MNKKLRSALLISIFSIGSAAIYAAQKGNEPGRETKENEEFEAWRSRPIEPFTDGEAMFARVKETLLKTYVDQTISEDDLYRAAIQGMLNYVDPDMSDWNRLLTPTEYEELISDVNGEIVGIGIEVGFDTATGYASVRGVIPDTSSARAGIEAGDQILKVDGQSFRGKQLRDVVYAIRGKPGTNVVLTLLHEDEVQTVTVTREPLVWDNVETEMLEGDIALITIRYFTKATPDLLKTALSSLAGKPLTGVVIDLRGNQGGLFESAVESIGLFVPKGQKIVTVLKRGAVDKTILTEADPLVKNVPLTVLIDGQTKSGAEVMAAALKFSANATTIGTATFGKWSAQTVEELPNKYAIKFTTAEFLAPDGSDLSGKGLTPDIAVKSSESVADQTSESTHPSVRHKEDTPLQTAINIIDLRQ